MLLSHALVGWLDRALPLDEMALVVIQSASSPCTLIIYTIMLFPRLIVINITKYS